MGAIEFVWEGGKSVTCRGYSSDVIGKWYTQLWTKKELHLEYIKDLLHNQRPITSQDFAVHMFSKKKRT